MSDKFNPAPLGLLGFGLTTILLNIHNAGFYELNAMIMAMGIFYGGLAQLVAGIFEGRKGNTFGAVAFTSYAMFWMTLVAIWVMPKLGLAEKPDALAMAWFLGIWGVLTAFLFIGTLKGNVMGKLVFSSLTVLFFLLAAATLTGNAQLHTIAGWEGIFCGACAFYEAVALVINDKLGKKLMPLV